MMCCNAGNRKLKVAIQGSSFFIFKLLIYSYLTLSGIPFSEVAGEDIGSLEDDSGDVDELGSGHCGS